MFLSFYFSVLILGLADENEMIQDSMISIAAHYRLDCLGIESWWG
jgi:hypothetical protein